MRVPSVGLTRDERQIVAEGYRLAEHMLAGYGDSSAAWQILRRWWMQLRGALLRI